MKFDSDQDAAMRSINEWWSSGSSPVYRLFGYAGTGKTTLAKHIAEGIDGNVLFGAYTGKAAHVLRNKGCDGAATIHSMIYRSRDKSKARLQELEKELADLVQQFTEESQEFIDNHPKVRQLRSEIAIEIDNVHQPNFILNHDSIVKSASLVIIDECSMIDEQMGEDLLSFGTPILVLGDPAQLPPIRGGGFFTENVRPDFMLENVHRQAQESPILRMATKVRLGEDLSIGDWGDDCWIHPKGTRLNPDEVLDYEQIIVGKNDTRHSSNMRMRELHDITEEYPVIGDRLVCLKNNSELGLLNGAIFYVSDVEGVFDGKVMMSVRPEDGTFSTEVQALEHHFLGRGEELKKQYWLRSGAHEFDYGYALTCHKSQGSQWSSVLIFDESYVFRANRQRWLYTAITRAADKVTVVKM